MPDHGQVVAERHFVEEMGLLFEESGASRMAGRIYGCLLVSDPPEQSSAALAETLGTSAASISTTTRLLLQMGLIARVPMPQERGHFFAVPADSLERAVAGDVMRMRLFRELCARGLQVLEGRPARVRERLQELHDLYAFMEAELPSLVERWRASARNQRGRADKGRPEGKEP